MHGFEFTVKPGRIGSDLVSRWYYVRSATHVRGIGEYIEVQDGDCVREMARVYTSRREAKVALVNMCGADVGGDVRIVRVDVWRK